MDKESEAVRDYKEIKDDYKWDDSIFNEDDERVSMVKEIINTKLSVVDKTIILLYVDSQSLRKLGKRFGVSHMSIRKEIQRIRRIILEEYNKMKDGRIHVK